MSSQVQFCVIETEDRSRIGKLDIPHRKSADWINFLVSPKQQVQLVMAEDRRGGLILYFQADEKLYDYLDQRLNRHETSPSNVSTMRQPAQEAIAN